MPCSRSRRLVEVDIARIRPFGLIAALSREAVNLSSSSVRESTAEGSTFAEIERTGLRFWTVRATAA
jgi:hypothetical protein